MEPDGDSWSSFRWACGKQPRPGWSSALQPFPAALPAWGAVLGPLLSPGSCQPWLCPTHVPLAGAGEASISAGPGKAKVSTT